MPSHSTLFVELQTYTREKFYAEPEWKKKMFTILIVTLFILAESHTTQASFSNDCMDVVITDCDRNFCDCQTKQDWPSAELCQLTCHLSGDSCQSWAYSSNNLVIT